MGVCPAGAREQAVMPPGTFGGNLDTRQHARHDASRGAGCGAGDNRSTRSGTRPDAGGRLCSSRLCVDLTIAEIVDAGQYVVSALLPLAIFRQ